MELITQLSKELHLRPAQVEAAISLIDAGNTIPFIARYRKEATGSLDDNALRDLHERLHYLRALHQRAQEIKEKIEEQGKLTGELERAILGASTLAELEDLYRPYRPKRRTRASIAKERGLKPLADFLLSQRPGCKDPKQEAADYVDDEKEVPDIEAALSGAMDIIAEAVSDDAAIRGRLRRLLLAKGKLRSVGEEEKESVYTLYYDFCEPLQRLSSHRVLAIDRGEREGFLKVSVTIEEPLALEILYSALIKGRSPCEEYCRAAAQDSFKRLLLPSLEREMRALLTEQADAAAIKVFSKNLRQLLLQPPLEGKVVLGLDPAYRTGCKIAVVDPTGKVLDTAVVYPTPPQNKKEEAANILKGLIRRHGVGVISIGNGTATGEAEQFVSELIASLPAEGLTYAVVSEAGASVYSASKLAAEEFPQYDVSLRSAVSIARRLQDPLAELVKIDPKAIGVGQYQHDMPQRELSESLGGVVEDCVNSVGVNLNTASHSLLGYVAGIGGALAKNIVQYREENGEFSSRRQLMKVPKLGKKAYEQCAGFLRIPKSKELLDNTAVHPESYEAAKGVLTLCGYGEEQLRAGEARELTERVEKIGYQELCRRLGVGEPTLRDIVAELQKPGRDPRESLPPPQLRTGVMDIKDLKAGMVLTGTVRNVIDFGAFVDIGVHQDGLVHISQLSERYVRHPLDVVSVGDVVKVRVLEIDQKRGRISLTMKQVEE